MKNIEIFREVRCKNYILPLPYFAFFVNFKSEIIAQNLTMFFN